MGAVIGVALFVAYLAALGVIASRTSRRRALADFATRNGLRIVGRARKPLVNGLRNGVPFALTGGHDLVLVASGARFTARPRSPFLGGLETVGDPTLDDALHLEGDPLVLQAVAARARPLLARMAGGSPITVANGQVIASLLDASAIEDSVAAATEAVRTSCLDEAGLLQAIASGIGPGFPFSFRRRCLEMLLERFPEHAVTREGLSRAFSDPDPRLRLYAATRAGAEGVPVLEGIVVDPQATPEIRIQALQLLPEDAFARTVDREEALGIATDALPRLREKKLGCALDALARGGTARAAHTIRTLLPSMPPDDRARAERALAAIEARLTARHGELSLAAGGDGGLTLSGGGELSLDRREKQKT